MTNNKIEKVHLIWICGFCEPIRRFVLTNEKVILNLNQINSNISLKISGKNWNSYMDTLFTVRPRFSEKLLRPAPNNS